MSTSNVSALPPNPASARGANPPSSVLSALIAKISQLWSSALGQQWLGSLALSLCIGACFGTSAGLIACAIAHLALGVKIYISSRPDTRSLAVRLHDELQNASKFKAILAGCDAIPPGALSACLRTATQNGYIETVDAILEHPCDLFIIDVVIDIQTTPNDAIAVKIAKKCMPHHPDFLKLDYSTNPDNFIACCKRGNVQILNIILENCRHSLKLPCIALTLWAGFDAIRDDLTNPVRKALQTVIQENGLLEPLLAAVESPDTERLLGKSFYERIRADAHLLQSAD